MRIYLLIAAFVLVVYSLPDTTTAQTEKKTEAAGQNAEVAALKKEIEALKEKLAKSNLDISPKALQEKALSTGEFLKQNLPDEKQLEEMFKKGKKIAGDLEKELSTFLNSEEFKRESENLSKLAGEFQKWGMKQKEALTKSAEDTATDLSIKSVREMVDQSVQAELPRLRKMLEMARVEAKKAGVDFDEKEMSKVQQLVEVSIANSLNHLESVASKTFKHHPEKAVSPKLGPLQKLEMTYAANLYNLEQLKKNSSPEVAAELEKAIQTLKASHAKAKLQLKEELATSSKETSKKKPSFFARLKKKAAAASKKLKEKLNEPVDEVKPRSGEMSEDELLRKLREELSGLKNDLKQLQKDNAKKSSGK